MSLNLNKVVLCGRITTTPELRITPSGLNVTSFFLAVNRKGKQGEEETADFIPCVAWRGTAEFICKYFRKGSALCITGAIQTRKWQDQRGETRYATEVVAEEALFAEAKNEQTSGTGAPPGGYAGAGNVSGAGNTSGAGNVNGAGNMGGAGNTSGAGPGAGKDMEAKPGGTTASKAGAGESRQAGVQKAGAGAGTKNSRKRKAAPEKAASAADVANAPQDDDLPF